MFLVCPDEQLLFYGKQINAYKRDPGRLFREVEGRQAPGAVLAEEGAAEVVQDRRRRAHLRYRDFADLLEGRLYPKALPKNPKAIPPKEPNRL